MTLDAKMISRTNAEALIPIETSTEIIKNIPHASAALSLFKQLPNMSAKQKTLPITSTLPTAYFLTVTRTWKKPQMTFADRLKYCHLNEKFQKYN